MNLSDVWTVFRKDWLQTIRDRNTLIIMLIGVLALPALSTVTAALLQYRIQSGATKVASLSILGEDAKWVAEHLRKKDLRIGVVPPATPLRNALEDVISQGAMLLQLPTNFRVDVESNAGTVPMTRLYIDNRRDNLEERSIVDSSLGDWRREIARQRLAGKLPKGADELDVKIDTRSVASNSDRTGAFFGLLLPIELTLSILLLGLYSSTELVTAERERGTLVLLAVAPPARRDILIGKSLVVLVTVLLGTALTLIAQTGLITAFVGKMADIAGKYTIVIPMPAIFFVLPFAVPLMIVLTAMSIAVCSYARNFQQAQSYASILLIAALLPAAAPLLPTSAYPPLMAVVPIANTALAIRDVLSGQLTLPFAFAVIISSALYAAVSLAVSVRLLDSEHSVFPQDEPIGAWRTSSRILFIFAGGVFLSYFVIGQTVQSIDILPGLILSQFCIIAGPTLFFLKWLRLPVAEVLSWRLPKDMRVLLAAPLLAPATTLVGCAIMAAQDLVLPAPKALSEMMLQILLPPGKPMWLVYVAVALTPAICEEILFRGTIQGILIRCLPPRVVLPITALGFGLFHMSAFRILPTGLLGFILCFLTYRYQSIFPSMILHFCHNALGVYLSVTHADPFSWQNIGIATGCGILALLVLKGGNIDVQRK